MARLSASVPARRLFEAIFGRAPGKWACGKGPSAGEVRGALGMLAEREGLLAIGGGDLGDDEIPGADELVAQGLAGLRQRGVRAEHDGENRSEELPGFHVASSETSMFLRQRSIRAAPWSPW